MGHCFKEYAIERASAITGVVIEIWWLIFRLNFSDWFSSVFLIVSNDVWDYFLKRKQYQMRKIEILKNFKKHFKYYPWFWMSGENNCYKTLQELKHDF